LIGHGQGYVKKLQCFEMLLEIALVCFDSVVLPEIGLVVMAL
jgi:hypothetical protein